MVVLNFLRSAGFTVIQKLQFPESARTQCPADRRKSARSWSSDRRERVAGESGVNIARVTWAKVI